MHRELGSLLGILLLTTALGACVGPQYDDAPDFGGDAAEDADAETEDDVDEAPCPDLAPRGDDVDAARAGFLEGVSAYSEGRYTDATLAFCRAYAAHAHWAIWYNVAKCETELGNADRAVAAYERFLAEGNGSFPEEMRTEVFDEIARLRRAPEPGR